MSLLPTHFPGHFAAEDVKAKLSELNQKWESLKSKASQRRQDLEDSLQAQQYFADANEAESWMREKEPIVGSTDYGKDEDSAEVPGPGGPAGLWLAPVRKMTPVEGAASWLLPFELFRNLFSLSTVKIQSYLRREKTACPRFSLLASSLWCRPHTRAHRHRVCQSSFLSGTESLFTKVRV